MSINKICDHCDFFEVCCNAGYCIQNTIVQKMDAEDWEKPLEKLNESRLAQGNLNQHSEIEVSVDFLKAVIKG